MIGRAMECGAAVGLVGVLIGSCSVESGGWDSTKPVIGNVLGVEIGVSMQQPAFVILGAGGGVGSATARILAEGGANLMLAGRSSENVTAVAQETGGIARLLDARQPIEVLDVVEEAVDLFGRVDGIANCVGSLLLKPAHLTTDDEFDETIATNLRSAFAAVKAGGKAMRSDGGSIVLVSSAAAQIGLANHEAIAAAKGGITGLTKAAAATYSRHGIRVNAVAPGLVRTRLTERLTGTEQAEQASLAMHALGRLGEPEDVGSAIAWLLDPAQSWVTGQVIGIDGGLGSIRSRA
jgi:NAD(P)-dependent dehydrogenase (short-subunit alcohol dehydrogenase family)